MAFSINTNIASLQAQNYLRASSDFQAKTINRVTSGLRIVSSGDDAAGLAIANGFRSDQSVLTQGIRNANDGLSTLQTIDGGMNNISQLLDRARTLATQSASGTFTGDRSVLNSEFQSVMGEIDRQSQAIGLNQNGQFAKSLSVFIGGGKGTDSSALISNGSVAVDLSKATVDTTSLGLNSFRAENGTYDIGDKSSTSVTAILKNQANTDSEAVTGKTRFTFSGAGFSDGNAINVDVNVSGVKDTASLVTAINTALQSAANPSSATAASTAFKNAGITASVVSDANGRQQLAFSAPNSAFQVQAGDLTANALLGNFDGTTGRGATLNTNYTGAVVAATATGGAAGAEQFIINGHTLSLGAVTAGADVDARVTAFNAAVTATTDTALKSFTAVKEGTSQIRIENTDGDSFTIQANAAAATDFGFSSATATAATHVFTDTGNSLQAAVPATTTHASLATGGTIDADSTNDAGTVTLTLTDGNGAHNLTVTLTGNQDAAGLVQNVQDAIDGDTGPGGIAGLYSASNVSGKLVITAADTTQATTFSISGADGPMTHTSSATGTSTLTSSGSPTAGDIAFTITDGAGAHNLTVTLAGTEDADGIAAAVQAAITGDSGAGGIAGQYTAANVDGSLVVTAADTTQATTFSIAATDGTGEAADLGLTSAAAATDATDVAVGGHMADLGLTGSDVAALDTPTTTPAGGGATAVGNAVITISDAAGDHAYTVNVTNHEDRGALVTALQAQIDGDVTANSAAGKYTVSMNATNNLVITANVGANAFNVTADANAQTDFALAAGPTAAAAGTMNASAAAVSTQANSVDSGGAQISSQYGDTKAYTWTNFSGGSQDITFSGTHADGTQYTHSFTLNGTTAPDLDSAVSELNSQLQASSDPSLKKIVAVKDADTSGALGVRFMSADDFSVKLGASTVAGQGLKDGTTALNNGQGAVLQSATSDGAGAVDISNQTTAQQAVTALATAVTNLGTAQAAVGKGQNQFNYAVNLAQSQVTNLAAAESRIRDADLASEAANLSKAQILVQAGTAALAQANSAPQAILSLLRG